MSGSLVRRAVERKAPLTVMTSSAQHVRLPVSPKADRVRDSTRRPEALS